jgi:hypothetical protein
VAGALQSDAKPPLMLRAGTCLTARFNSCPIGEVAPEFDRILVIDHADLLDAERTDASAAESPRSTLSTFRSLATGCVTARAPVAGRSAKCPPCRSVSICCYGSSRGRFAGSWSGSVSSRLRWTWRKVRFLDRTFTGGGRHVRSALFGNRRIFGGPVVSTQCVNTSLV